MLSVKLLFDFEHLNRGGLCFWNGSRINRIIKSYVKNYYIIYTDDKFTVILDENFKCLVGAN